MTKPDMYEHFQRISTRVDGFFTEESQAVWVNLLSMQKSNAIGGNMLEIGVLNGKSALLAGLFLERGQVFLLIDVGNTKNAVNLVKRNTRGSLIDYTGRSSAFSRSSYFARYQGSIRWLHIDGDHSGYSVYNDLLLAALMVAPGGVICVDDFFNVRYPQLSAAVYKFLFQRMDFKMFLCGANKAYICRTEDYVIYEDNVRRTLAADLRSRNFNISVAKTSYAHDMGCFAVEPRFVDRDMVGRDEDYDDIVF